MITDTIEALGLDYDIVGDEAVMPCPVHQRRTGKEDGNPSFSINIDSGLMFCFSCGYRGHVTRLVVDLLGKSWGEAQDFVGKADPPVSVLRKRLDKPRHPAPSRFDRATFYAMDYPDDQMLADRGITRESAERFDLRKHRDGWAIPIHHVNGDLVGFQLKRGNYVRNFPQGVRKAEALFGLPHITDPSLTVVESPLDAVLADQWGVPCVATFGATVSPAQLEALTPYRVTLAFDSDDAGQVATDTVSRFLASRGVRHRVVQWPDGVKDFGDRPDLIPSLVLNAKNPLKAKVLSWG